MRIETSARALLLLGATAILFACNKQAPAANDSANAAAAAPSANAAAPAEANVASSSAPAAAGAVTTDFLVGKWSAMGEDCRATVEFKKDGTAVTPVGEAKWTLAGDKLKFDYGDGSNQPPSTVKALGSDRIETTTQSGNKDTQKRC